MDSAPSQSARRQIPVLVKWLPGTGILFLIPNETIRFVKKTALPLHFFNLSSDYSVPDFGRCEKKKKARQGRLSLALKLFPKNRKSLGRLFLSDNLRYPAYNRVGVESFHFLNAIIGAVYVRIMS